MKDPCKEEEEGRKGGGEDQLTECSLITVRENLRQRCFIRVRKPCC